MKKILCIILTLFIFSCEDIGEHITNYTYLEYMNDGWEAFEYQEWDLGKELFNTGLNQESDNFSEAYSGLGWIYLYEANTMPGELNKNKRDSLRSLSELNFNLAYQEDNLNDIVWSDVLVGSAYNYSYKSDSLLALYYNNTFTDDALWDLMIEYSNNAIAITDDLFSLNSDYNFQYDDCINKNNIRILRAQLFFKTQNYFNIYYELSELSDEYTCPNGQPDNLQDAIECISIVSNILFNCN